MPCPFGPSFPGWRMLIEAFYNPVPGRTYGSLNYGDEVYGDANNAGPLWVDVTEPHFDVTVTVGAAEPSGTVPVNELTIVGRDDAGAWWDFAAPARYNLPYVWTPVRVTLIDPADVHHVIGYGRVERIADQHTKPPRQVVVTCYGNVSTLVTGRADWSRPAEPVDARAAALFAVAANPFPWSVVPPERPGLLADAAARTINVRDELDRTAASAGMFVTEDPDGTVRLRRWPLEHSGDRIYVTDCLEADNADMLLGGDTLYAADTAALLNVAEATNTAGAVASSRDVTSVAIYDEHAASFGFPQSGLAFADVATAQAVTDRAVARWANIVNHVDAVNVDTAADRRWLAALADLTLGRPVAVERRGVAPFTLDTVLIGWTSHLVRNRCTSTLYTSTVTPTL